MRVPWVPLYLEKIDSIVVVLPIFKSTLAAKSGSLFGTRLTVVGHRWNPVASLPNDGHRSAGTGP
jgi:hypothetical protein